MKAIFLLATSLIFTSATAFSAEKLSCGEVLAKLAIWAHGDDYASIKNEYKGSPTFERNFNVTTLGGGFNKSVGRARFSNDSSWIAGEHANGTLGLWNVKEQKEMTIAIPNHRIYSFDFSPDSKQVMVRFAGKDASACCGNENSIQIYSLETGQPISGHIPTHGSHATAYFSNDGRWLLAENDNTFHIIDAQSGQDTGRKIARDLNFRTDGDYVLGLSGKDIVRVSSLSTGKELAVLDLKIDSQVFGDLSARRGLVVLEDNEGGMPKSSGIPVLRDLNTLAPLPLKLDAAGIPKDAKRIGPDLSSDGGWVYALYYLNEKPVGVSWETTTGKQVHRIADASVHPVYTEDEEWGAIGVEKRSRDSDREEKTTTVFSRSGATRTFPGSPLGFLGTILVTEVQNNLAHHLAYYFNDITTGKTAKLDNQGHELSIAPDGSRFFFTDAGALKLYETNPRAIPRPNRH